jgi:hypothetical protein
MLAIIRTHRSSALSASAMLGLIGTLGAFGIEAPATPQPAAAPAERSISGKIVDRLPGSLPATSRFAETPAPSDWSMMAVSDSMIAVAYAAGRENGQADSRPVPDAAARSATLALKSGHARAARPHGGSPAVALLPPARPAALRMPQPAAQAVAPPERPASIAARMIAYVGSLASLARPL